MKHLVAWCLPLLAACAASTPPAPPPPTVVAPATASASAPPAASTTIVATPPRPSGPLTPAVCKLAWTEEPVWSPSSPSVGPATARLTIVWFFDLDDPFTARVVPTILDLRDELGHDHVRLVWRHHPLPFHTTARRAAKAAQHVFEQRGGEAFLRFIRAVLDHRPPHSDDRLFELASREGITSRPELDAALEDPRHDEAFDASANLARDLGLRGVPAFLVNGETISGAQPLEKFRDAARRATIASRQEGHDACVATQRALPRPADEPSPPAAGTADQVEFFAIPVGASPARGPADAPVTIVAFGGYQDPFSRRATTTLRTILDKHKDQLRYVWKDFPLAFHQLAVPAASLVRRANARSGPAAFFRVHDELMASSKIDDPTLAALAAKHGLGKPTTAKTREISEDLALGEAAGVTGTPTFFINGRKLVGARPEEEFERVIGEELAKAKRLLARGTPKASIYDAALRANGAKPAVKKP